MNILSRRKDGGIKSPVDAYFLFEFKSLGSIALLKFNKGGREEFHNHAFNAWTWFLGGRLLEEDVSGKAYQYRTGWKPKFTPKNKNHRVIALEDSYCLTIRGRWDREWTEYSREHDTTTVFSWGRKVKYKRRGL